MRSDHIFDHRQTRNTRKQRNTERRRAYKTERKAPKIEARSGNYAPSVVGVIEAAGSNPLTQTRKSPMVAKLSDFFVFLFSLKMAFGARIVQDFFVLFPPVVEAGAKKRAFCLQKKETEKMACIQKRDNGNYIVNW